MNLSPVFTRRIRPCGQGELNAARWSESRSCMAARILGPVPVLVPVELLRRIDAARPADP